MNREKKKKKVEWKRKGRREEGREGGRDECCVDRLVQNGPCLAAQMTRKRHLAAFDVYSHWCQASLCLFTVQSCSRLQRQVLQGVSNEVETWSGVSGIYCRETKQWYIERTRVIPTITGFFFLTRTAASIVFVWLPVPSKYDMFWRVFYVKLLLSSTRDSCRLLVTI